MSLHMRLNMVNCFVRRQFIIIYFLGRGALKYRTTLNYKVLQYLFFVATSKNVNKERTIREISRALGVGYWNVWKIVWRLQKDECVDIKCYKYAFSERNYFMLHAIVSLEDKSHQKSIIKKIHWFHNKK